MCVCVLCVARSRVMCQVWNCMEIEYLPVYVPSSEDQQNPTLFAQHVQVTTKRGLGLAVPEGRVYPRA